jgi:2,6-dihydroxypyridine 3-monooxygenase
MSPALGELRVAVAGGSIGGLTAAALLRDLGCRVEVFERTAGALSGFGAGIVAHPATTRYFTERLGASVAGLTIGCRVHRYVDASGAVVHEEPTGLRFTSWGTLYRHLLESVGEARYRRGVALVGFDQDADAVDVRFANGRAGRFELLVCADGIHSTGRRRLFPDVEPTYASYVAWRGTVGEDRLSPSAFESVHDAITYQVAGLSHALAYPIPSTDGSVETGERLLNFVWYRNVPLGPELDELMTDRDGFPRPISLHPGAVQQRYVDELRRDAAERLAPALAEMVARTEHPFVQALADVETPRMAVGRVCLIGDAAFAGRPHAAAGSAKAAENAWTLAEALEASGGDVPAALAAWEPAQLELGRNLVARTREMGERSQVRGTWTPGDPSLRFGLYGPGA